MASEPAVPTEHVKALLRLLYPDEMTPHAHRLFEQAIQQYEVEVLSTPAVVEIPAEPGIGRRAGDG